MAASISPYPCTASGQLQFHPLIKEIVVHEDMSEGGRNTTVEIYFVRKANFAKAAEIYL